MCLLIFSMVCNNLVSFSGSFLCFPFEFFQCAIFYVSNSICKKLLYKDQFIYTPKIFCYLFITQIQLLLAKKIAYYVIIYVVDNSGKTNDSPFALSPHRFSIFEDFPTLLSILYYMLPCVGFSPSKLTMDSVGLRNDSVSRISSENQGVSLLYYQQGQHGLESGNNPILDSSSCPDNLLKPSPSPASLVFRQRWIGGGDSGFREVLNLPGSLPRLRRCLC